MARAKTALALLLSIGLAACAPRRVVRLGPPASAPAVNPHAGTPTVLTRFRVRNVGDKDDDAALEALKAQFLEHARALGGWSSLTEGAEAPEGALSLEVDLFLGLDDKKNFLAGMPVFFPIWGVLWPFTPRSGRARVTGTASLLDGGRRLVAAKSATKLVPFEVVLWGWVRTRPLEEAFRAAYEGVFARLAALEPPGAAQTPSDALPPSELESPGYSLPAREADLAVVVGIERYAAAPTAPFAERDARAVKAHLLALGYPERGVLLLLGEAATREALERNIGYWLRRNVTPSSRVAFYFAGNGGYDSASGEAALLPFDGDPEYLAQTGYPLRRLFKRLAALKAARAAVVLDASFAGTGARAVLPPGMPAPASIKPPEPPSDLHVFYASGDTAGTDEGAGHGLLTRRLLRSLQESRGALDAPF